MADVPLRTVIRRLATLVSARQLGGLSDAALLQRFVAQHDEAAFEVLVWRHGVMVLGVCERVLRHGADAEDAFQASFLALAREATSIGKGEAVAGWLYRVAYRIALKGKAGAARRKQHESRFPGTTARAPSDDLVWQDLRPILDEEVNRLPDKYRHPFVLCYLEGKSNTEAARQLGCPPGTIATRLAWARERLRSRLTRRGVELSLASLAAALAAEAARAAPPALLVEGTVQAVLSSMAGLAAGSAAFNGTTTLIKGMVKAMSLTRWKTLTLILLGVSVLAAGVTVLSHGAFAGKVEPAQVKEEPAKPGRQPANEADAGDPRSVLGQSLEAADTIKEDPPKVHVLVHIALMQEQAGDRPGALKTLDQALRVAGRLAEDPSITLALHWITEAQVRIGDHKGALRAVDLLRDAGQKNHLLFLIAGEQAAAGAIAEALKTAEAMTDDQKDGALEAVACAYAGKGDVKAALQLAEQLKHQPLARAGALEEIARAQAKAGDKTGAAASLQEALRLDEATLAGEDARSSARARIAITRAQTGDFAGALETAAGLQVEEDKSQALQGIAVQQVKAMDLKSALKTIDGINNEQRKAHALMAVAETQADAGNRDAAQETLRAAQRVGDSLRDDAQKEACRWDLARTAIKAGDVKPALALVQAHPKSEERAWALLDVAEAQAASGDRVAAAGTLKQAWEAAGTLKGEGDNPMGVRTLAPRWLLMKGHLLRRLAAGLVQAGEQGDALTRAGKEELPFLKALALMGAAEGMVARKKPAGEVKPPPNE
jgi:RNA polymerase sigma factor (sigma-70 family)